VKLGGVKDVDNFLLFYKSFKIFKTFRREGISREPLPLLYLQKLQNRKWDELPAKWDEFPA
jgi:hypothetical protein